MVVSKKAIYQYALLYCLLLLNQAVASKVYGMMLTYVVIGLAVMIGIIRCPQVFGSVHVIIPICGLAIGIIIVRLSGSALGIGFLILVASDIVVASVASEIDRENVRERYINLVCVMAVISLVGFVSSQLFPDLTRNVLGLSYSEKITFSQGIGWANSTDWNYYGHWLFSFGREQHRNCGIYTEPGLFVIVLISAITMLLYCEDTVNISDKSGIRKIILLSIVTVTTGSATGFLMLCLVVFIRVTSKNKQENDIMRWRLLKMLPFAVGIVLLAGCVDVAVRGNESFVNIYLLDKFQTLSFSGAVTGTGSTGNARLLGVLQGLATFAKYPLGAGLNRVLTIGGANNAAGCGLFYYLGVLGLIGWISVVAAFIIPWRRIQNTGLKYSLMVLYIIYGIAQGNFWTGIILICALSCNPMRKENVK